VLYLDTGLAKNYEQPPPSFDLNSAKYEISPCQQDSGGVNEIEVVATTLGFLIMIMNLLAIILIIRNSNLHRAVYFCICNLAVADFLAGLLLFWVFFLQKVSKRESENAQNVQGPSIKDVRIKSRKIDLLPLCPQNVRTGQPTLIADVLTFMDASIGASFLSRIFSSQSFFFFPCFLIIFDWLKKASKESRPRLK